MRHMAVAAMDARWFTFLSDVAAEGADPAAGGNGPSKLLLMMAALGLLFYFMILRPQRAKEQRFRDMVGGLKENDRVVTIGGIYGVVTNVQRDVDRITLRIDESNNTKIRVTSSAIARVLTDDSDTTTKVAESQPNK